MTVNCIFSHQPLFFRGKSKLSKGEHVQFYKFASSGKIENCQSLIKKHKHNHQTKINKPKSMFNF